MPTWSINGNANSAGSFIMNPFTATVPNLYITAGNPITYPININYNSTNSGISFASISPTSYNIESATFTPSVTVTTDPMNYLNGYSGYTITPAINAIGIGTIGNKDYTIMGTPITYSITNTLGAGINSAILSHNNYNIKQTPFNVA